VAIGALAVSACRHVVELVGMNADAQRRYRKATRSLLASCVGVRRLRGASMVARGHFRLAQRALCATVQDCVRSLGVGGSAHAREVSGAPVVEAVCSCDYFATFATLQVAVPQDLLVVRYID
jgi:hypothetical protein